MKIQLILLLQIYIQVHQNKINIQPGHIITAGMISHNPSSNRHQYDNQNPQHISTYNKQDIKHELEHYEEVHWAAMFMDDKFYLAHPLALDKLAKLNAQIRMEKNKLLIFPSPAKIKENQQNQEGAVRSEVYGKKLRKNIIPQLQSMNVYKNNQQQDDESEENDLTINSEQPQRRIISRKDLYHHAIQKNKKQVQFVKETKIQDQQKNKNIEDGGNRQEVQQRQNNDSRSQFSFHSRQCRTQINQLKMLRMQLQAQKQLREEQDKYHKMVQQLRLRNYRKKKQRHQPVVNASPQVNNNILDGLNDSKNDNSRVSNKSRKTISIRSIGSKNKQKKSAFMFAPSQLGSRVRKQDNGSQNNSNIQSQRYSQKSKSNSVSEHSHNKNFIISQPVKKGASSKNERQSRQSKIDSSSKKSSYKQESISYKPTNSKKGQKIIQKESIQDQKQKQINRLTQKIKQMQAKLCEIQNKQGQLEEESRIRNRYPEQQSEQHEQTNNKMEERQQQQMIVERKVQNNEYYENKESEEGQKYNKQGQLDQNEERQQQGSMIMGDGKQQELECNKEQQAINRQQQQQKKKSLTLHQPHHNLLLSSSIVNYNYSQHLHQVNQQKQDQIEKQRMKQEIQELNKVIRQLKLEKIRKQEQHKENSLQLHRQDKEQQPKQRSSISKYQQQKQQIASKDQQVDKVPLAKIRNNHPFQSPPKNNPYSNNNNTFHTIHDLQNKNRRYDYDNQPMMNTICIYPSHSHRKGSQEEEPILRKKGDNERIVTDGIHERQSRKQQANQLLVNYNNHNVILVTDKESHLNSNQNSNNLPPQKKKRRQLNNQQSTKLPTSTRLITKSLQSSREKMEISSQQYYKKQLQHQSGMDDKIMNINSSRKSQEFFNKTLNKKGIIVRQVIDGSEDNKTEQEFNVQSRSRKLPEKDSCCRYEEPPSPTNTGKKIFELQFVKKDQQSYYVQGQDYAGQDERMIVPKISQVEKFKIPQLPNPPNPQISQFQFQNLARKVFEAFGINVADKDHLLVKKYKNCAIFKTPESKKTVVWHFNGKFYFGGWEQNQNGEGKKSGDGFQYIPQKHYYQGQFYEGKRNGSGTMIQVNGNVYQGQWQKGEKHGIGKYYQESSGAIYEGQWKEGKKYGHGILKVSNKEFYEGTFLKSVKHGFGKQKFSTGDSYKGEYKLGRFHGRGKYTWANGSSYDGNFVEGQRQGRGYWQSALKNGDTYTGQYQEDKKNGRGQYRWANGCKYTGYFTNDVKNGVGKVEYPDGRQIKGFWQMGKLVQIDQKMKEDDQQQKSSHQDEPLVNNRVKLEKVYESPSKQLQASKNIHRI